LERLKITVKIYADGAARGNPGPSAWAFILMQGEKMLEKKSEYLGMGTNNNAEYSAILNALKRAKELKHFEVRVFSDSQLIIKQLNQEWSVRNPNLKKIHTQIVQILKQFNDAQFIHVPRENKFIKICDRLCNECLDLRDPS
jgi:ribonuclease HI